MRRPFLTSACLAALAAVAAAQTKPGDGFVKPADSPALKKAVAAYDAYPEAIRADLVREFRAEVERVKKAVKDSEAQAAQARTRPDKLVAEKKAAVYKARLAKREVNDPPYLDRGRAQGLLDARVKELGYDRLTPAERKVADNYLAHGGPPSIFVDPQQSPLSRYEVGTVGQLGFHSGRPATVRQVIRDDQMIITGPRVGRTDGDDIWLDGVPTRGVADGDPLDMKDLVVEVVGTKRYTTAAGTGRTVRHLRAVDLTNVYRIVRDPEVGRLDAWAKGKG